MTPDGMRELIECCFNFEDKPTSRNMILGIISVLDCKESMTHRKLKKYRNYVVGLIGRIN